MTPHIGGTVAIFEVKAFQIMFKNCRLGNQDLKKKKSVFIFFLNVLHQRKEHNYCERYFCYTEQINFENIKNNIFNFHILQNRN